MAEQLEISNKHCIVEKEGHILIVTDIAVIHVTQKGLVPKEVAPGWTPEEVQTLTEPTLIVDPNCQEITLM